MAGQRGRESPGWGYQPFIANVYLNAFDQFMKDRGYRILRFADDILILTRSRSAAHNALKVSRNYLEGELPLTVNEQKSRIVHSSEGVSYLGGVIGTRYTRSRDERVRKFKDKVKGITRRNSPVNLEKVIKDLKPVLRGWVNYFRVANCTEKFRALMR